MMKTLTSDVEQMARYLKAILRADNFCMAYTQCDSSLFRRYDELFRIGYIQSDAVELDLSNICSRPEYAPHDLKKYKDKSCGGHLTFLASNVYSLLHLLVFHSSYRGIRESLKMTSKEFEELQNSFKSAIVTAKVNTVVPGTGVKKDKDGEISTTKLVNFDTLPVELFVNLRSKLYETNQDLFVPLDEKEQLITSTQKDRYKMTLSNYGDKHPDLNAYLNADNEAFKKLITVDSQNELDAVLNGSEIRFQKEFMMYYYLVQETLKTIKFEDEVVQSALYLVFNK